MKPINVGGHSAYQNRVLSQLHKYYPDASTSLSSSTWQILDKFWNLDLSSVDVLMQDRYSSFGPEPRLPSDMLRAILVSVEFKITSYTRFAADLKEIIFMQLFPAFPSGILPALELSMTSTNAFGYQITRIFQLLSIHLRKNLRNQKEKKKRLLLLKKQLSRIYFTNLKKHHLLTWLLVLDFGKSSILFFFRLLPGKTLYLSKSLLWPAMVLLYIRQLKNEKTVPAIVWKKVSVIANAIEFIINRL